MLFIKRVMLSMFVVFFISTMSVVNGYAADAISKDDALVDVFGPNYSFSTETVRLQGEKLDKIIERLGGKLVYEQIGSESKTVEAHKKIEFHYAMRDGEKIGVGIVDMQPGKWGPVEFMIAVMLDDPLPKVKRIEVMSMQERRGRPIARSSYMKQYVGKTTENPLEVGEDIIAITGATISSRAASFSVKKALVLVEECIYQK